MISFWSSLVAYLKLYKAGFRISRSGLGIKPTLVIHRFYWNDKVIRTMPDIDSTGSGHWNTVFDGHIESLS